VIRAAIYARISSDGEGDHLGVRRQVAYSVICDDQRAPTVVAFFGRAIEF
jgi:hypothetical protein